MLPDKEFEDLIRQKMAALDEAPPADGWKKIAADIKPPKKPRAIWWWIGPLLLLLTGAGIYYYTNKSSVKKPDETLTITENKKNTPVAASVNPDVQKENSTIAKRNNKIAPKSSKLSQPPALSIKTNKSAITSLKDKTIQVKVSPGDKLNAGRTAGEGGTRRTVPVKADNSITLILADTMNQPERQPALAQPGDIAKNKPAESAGADSAGNLVKPIQPDSVLVAAKKDSVVPENKALDQEQKTEEAEKKNKPNVWEAGFSFASRYAFRQFTPNASDNIFITQVNTRNKSNPERLGYEFGFNLARALTQNLYVETGLAWLQLKENLTYTYTNGTIDTIVVTATTNQTRINPVYKMEERRLASSYAYGGWRLGASYYFWNNGRRRFNFSVAGGINLLIKGETQEYQNGQYVRKVVFPSRANILEQANYNLLVGAGYNTRLGQHFELMLMPSLNYFMGSTFKEREPLGLRPYSLGLNIALKRRFSRQN
ncbi:hypothetical protein AAE02nite_27340 [Adhaeribacter aerolatus]|uniref:Outer membrane protein beta-barrel domain-containing protein n=1 Tax=Adhaeribacter aerolatus TaxID=670289 RepID=A0A512AZE1_9BACT|nr:hypothetical protein [Adhaeribacter aerolatus]GEO05070.1 hypothetical protein AAE02nite_27340 [Adhaeribacter aerolatus]